VTLDTLWRLAAGFLLIGLNAFFVAVEFALTRLPNLDLTEEELRESKGLARAVEMLDRLEIHLTGCQLGISATSLLLGVVAEPAVTRLIEPLASLVGLEGNALHATSVVVAVVAMNLIHKIWGEQAPTYLGVERPRGVARRLAPILSVWTTVMGPLIRLGDGAAKGTLGIFGIEITRSWAEEEVGEGAEGTGSADGSAEGADGAERAAGPPGDRAELKRRITSLLKSRNLPDERREEVVASLEIDEIPAREIMVSEVVVLALDASSEATRERLAEAGHVRYPVLASGLDPDTSPPYRLDDIAGLVYLPSLFAPPERLTRDPLELEDVLEEPVICDVDLPVAHLIDRLQEERQELALLREGDRMAGIATITDALESIAGEVEDPLDAESR
jgi:CBS domain containing-hemolysin-like protein